MHAPTCTTDITREAILNSLLREDVPLLSMNEPLWSLSKTFNERKSFDIRSQQHSWLEAPHANANLQTIVFQQILFFQFKIQNYHQSNGIAAISTQKSILRMILYLFVTHDDFEFR